MAQEVDDNVTKRSNPTNISLVVPVTDVLANVFIHDAVVWLSFNAVPAEYSSDTSTCQLICASELGLKIKNKSVSLALTPNWLII